MYYVVKCVSTDTLIVQCCWFDCSPGFYLNKYSNNDLITKKFLHLSFKVIPHTL